MRQSNRFRFVAVLGVQRMQPTSQVRLLSGGVAACTALRSLRREGTFFATHIHTGAHKLAQSHTSQDIVAQGHARELSTTTSDPVLL